MNVLLICSTILALAIAHAPCERWTPQNPAPALAEQRSADDDSQRVRDRLIALCEELRRDLGPREFVRIEDVDGLLPVSSWRRQDSQFVVTGEFDDHERPVAALPWAGLMGIKHLWLGQSGGTWLRFHCRDFTVDYYPDPLQLADYLNEALITTTTECNVPDDVRERVGKRLKNETELVWRCKGLEVIASKPDYSRATVEDLYRWVVYAKLAGRTLGICPSLMEMSRGHTTILVEYFEPDILAGKLVYYSVFVNGSYLYSLAVSKHREVGGFQYSEGWEKNLADVHCSILYYGLGMSEREDRPAVRQPGEPDVQN